MADSFATQMARALGRLEALEKGIPLALPDAVAEGAVILRDEVKARAPRDRGDLADSIGDEAVEQTPNSATHAVFVGAFYARFQEYGTRHHAARPFMRPAADTKRQEVAQTVLGVVKKKVGLS